MKFLVDENLSTKLVDELRTAGHDATHVSALGLSAAPDQRILDLARDQGRIVLSADSDFGTLLAADRAPRPSVILIRRSSGRRAPELAAMIAENMAQLEEDLGQGCVVVFDADRIRVRKLPLI